jgi:glycosyltransferase involved in cell wall biosynthesis
LKVGVFHPPLNYCGGAEWVAVKITQILKNSGHEIVVLTDEKIDEEKIKKMFGSKVQFDFNLVFPFRLFPKYIRQNVYTNAIRSLYLKSKCDLIIDTHSNAILPFVNITYVHYPLFGFLQYDETAKVRSLIRSLFYFPYKSYERKNALDNKRLILSNSKYTNSAVRKLLSPTSRVLCPPIPESFFATDDNLKGKENLVVSFARLSPNKQLTTIPLIAKKTKKNINFLIIGLCEDARDLSTYNEILRLIEENDVSDRVRVKTSVPLEEAIQIFKKAKVFLHPKIGEHFGIAVVEAMASGCVPIVHNSGGPKDFVPELFRFDNLEEATEKINKAVTDWSPQLSMQIRELAEPFSEKSFSKEFLLLFNKFI